MQGKKKEKKSGKGNTNYIVLFWFFVIVIIGFLIRKAKDSSKTSTIALKMLLN